MANQSKLRVVFTGHAGLLKKKSLSQLCQYIYEKDPLWREAHDNNDDSQREQIEKKLAQVYDAEAILKPMLEFLELGDWRAQQSEWWDSVTKMIDLCNREDPDYAFFSLHMSYQWHSGFFTPFQWRIPIHTHERSSYEEYDITTIIRESFKPDYCITLIDDIQSVQKRINPEIHLRLRELLTWRNIEILMTDILAKETINKSKYNFRHFPFEYSQVVSIRHPTSMLHRLLFEQECPRIYASFPITRTRNSHRNEIDRFRNALHDNFAVFDPLTIDERLLQIRLVDLKADQGEMPKNTIFSPDDRWFIDPERTLCGEVPEDININIDEIEEIAEQISGARTAIDRNIRTRDLRFIDQADCVVVYRPQFYEGRLSGGTEAEIRYAKSTRKPVFLIHDPSNDGDLKPDAFDVEFLAGDRRFDNFYNLSDPSN